MKHFDKYTQEWRYFDVGPFWLVNPDFKNRKRYSGYRHMRTTSEKKNFIAHTDLSKEYGVKLRRKRSPRSLIDAYDDIHIKCYETKSWKKNYRNNKQWQKKK